MSKLKTVEHLQAAGLAEMFGDHVGEPGASKQLVLEGEIAE